MGLRGSSGSFTELSPSRKAAEMAQSWDLEIKPQIGNWTSSWLAALTHPQGLGHWWPGRAWASCTLVLGRAEARSQGSAPTQAPAKRAPGCWAHPVSNEAVPSLLQGV